MFAIHWGFLRSAKYELETHEDPNTQDSESKNNEEGKKKLWWWYGLLYSEGRKESFRHLFILTNLKSDYIYGRCINMLHVIMTTQSFHSTMNTMLTNRYNPCVMIVMQGLSKLLTLVIICYLSVNVYQDIFPSLAVDSMLANATAVSSVR